MALGVDIVTEALTKYASGHSDVLMGAITFAREDIAATVQSYMARVGIGVSPDDASLVLRGMETMGLRFAHSRAGAERLIERIGGHRLVERILWPPLPGSPGHDVWARDFSGAAGIFSVVFREGAAARIGTALDTLQTFAIGASWGGTHSLMAPMSIRTVRSVRPWSGDDLILRVSVGLEDITDLEADVDRLLAALEAPA